MKKAILLGTDHLTQLGNNQKESYPFYVEELCKTNNIKAIAEEIHTQSIAADISANLNIEYIIIEPNLEEREKLGIEDRTEIDYEFEFKHKVSIDDLPPKEYAAYNRRIQNVYRERELEWFKRICKLDTWPLLIICGANHCQPFFNLLSKEGIDIVKDSGKLAVCQNT